MSALLHQTDAVTHPQRLAELRSRAASRLTGAAATKGAPASAGDALTVLHALASSPDTAPDALALLHELQVHQVEVELQAEELHESRAELEAALHRQSELYDFQPFGCFTIDARMVVYELNRTGADMLGIERDEAFGMPLDSFLRADSARRFRAVVASVDAGVPRASCRLELRPRQGPERAVLAGIGKDPAADRYLVSLVFG
ncbi:MAG TPA: PAS domain-containing protein [Burkholderiaceae bacterium]|nr:PAS domain-containing protein [Burkholderiaceae bacterium]